MDSLLDNSDVPAAPPPPGQTSNFVDPPSIGNSFLIPNVVFLSLAIVAVAFRMYTRLYLLRSWGTDDLVRHGTGKHMWDVRLSEYSPTFLKLYLADVLTWIMAILFTKLSILLLYKRIFPVSSRLFVGVWWATFCITFGYLVSGFIASLFACVPIATAWDVNIKDGHCISRATVYISITSFGMLTDVALLLAPVIVLWDLALSRKQKIVVFLLLSMGSFTVFVGIYRLPLLIKFLDEGSSDISYTLVPTATWSLIEVNSAILCACAVTLKPLINRYWNNILTPTVPGTHRPGPIFTYNSEAGRPTFRSHRTPRSEHRQPGSRPEELPIAIEGIRPSRHSRPMRLDDEPKSSAEVNDVEMGMDDGRNGEGFDAVSVGELHGKAWSEREKEEDSEEKSMSGHSFGEKSSL